MRLTMVRSMTLGVHENINRSSSPRVGLCAYCGVIGVLCCMGAGAKVMPHGTDHVAVVSHHKLNSNHGSFEFRKHQVRLLVTRPRAIKSVFASGTMERPGRIERERERERKRKGARAREREREREREGEGEGENERSCVMIWSVLCLAGDCSGFIVRTE